MRVHVSSPESCPTVSIRALSEKIVVIKEMRSCAGRVGLINRFQAGSSLETRSSQVNENTVVEWTRNQRGEECFQGFWNFRAQMRVVIPTPFRQPPQIICEGWMCRPWWTLLPRCGQHSRDGLIFREWNRTGEYLRRYGTMVSQPRCTADRPRRTSIMTIAKEKMSISLLGSSPFRTSGAVHLENPPH